MAGTTLGLLFLLSALLAAARGDCPSGVASADDCLQKSGFSDLKQKQRDPNSYCEQGSILAAKAANCLRDCNYNEENSYLQDQKNTINTFCSQNIPGCPAVADTFINQTRCYDDYGGLSVVVSKIIEQFEAKVPTINCNYLYWGRSCQTMQTCSVNLNLDEQLIQGEGVPLALAICGSEKLQDALKYLEVTEGCSSAVDSAIASKCNISCAVADADCSTICSLLESQVQCFQNNIVNCTALERRYVLPRLNTYAIANRYFGCSIKYNGITVRPAGADKAYSSLINQCLFTDTIEGAFSCERILPLLNRDTPIVGFCQTKNDSYYQTVNCRNAYLGVATPQSKLLTRTQDLEYDQTAWSEFSAETGAFPLDGYGMANIYDSIPDKCPNGLIWTNRLCVPTADRPVSSTTTTSTPETSTETASTSSVSRTTPRPGQGYTPSKRPNSQGDQGDQGNQGNQGNQGESFALRSSAGMVMPTVFLIIVSLLGALLQY